MGFFVADIDTFIDLSVAVCSFTATAVKAIRQLFADRLVYREETRHYFN